MLSAIPNRGSSSTSASLVRLCKTETPSCSPFNPMWLNALRSESARWATSGFGGGTCSNKIVLAAHRGREVILRLMDWVPQISLSGQGSLSRPGARGG